MKMGQRSYNAAMAFFPLLQRLSKSVILTYPLLIDLMVSWFA